MAVAESGAMKANSPPRCSSSPAACWSQRLLARRERRNAGEWRHYGADKASSRYSPLDQIDRDNVTSWSRSGAGARPTTTLRQEAKYRPGFFKTTPLMVGGRLILHQPRRGGGARRRDRQDALELRPQDLQGRATRQCRLAAPRRRVLDRRQDRAHPVRPPRSQAGIPRPRHRQARSEVRRRRSGYTELATRLGRDINTRQYTHNSPPIVCGDTVVVGSIVSDGPTAPRCRRATCAATTCAPAR